ncbi:retrovirus-related pol polyprotein from transposon TNT 1-94 [Tanacetum coccineum]
MCSILFNLVSQCVSNGQIASEQFSLGPELQLLTPRTISSGLMQKPHSPTPYVPLINNNWDILFQPMFDEYFNPPPSVASLVPAVVAPEPADLTGTPSSTPIDQDAPSPNNVIDNPSQLVSTRHQLQTEAMFCYFDAFFTSVEIKNYKEALKESCWIKAMQEELNEFERLEVWELIPRPDRIMIITLKWIFKVKLDELGGV